VCTIASCPGGKYAKAALEGLGIWDAVKGKLVDQETIRVALAAVARGEVKFAIVYSTDAKIEPRVRVVDSFPAGSYPPIVFPAAIVSGSQRPAARAFLEFLRSADGAAMFERHGFVVPKR
jgi:molybdate transport system substrate-binding protein